MYNCCKTFCESDFAGLLRVDTLCVGFICGDKCTDLVEEQDEIESEGDEQGQEPKVVEVTRKVVLVGDKEVSKT